MTNLHDPRDPVTQSWGMSQLKSKEAFTFFHHVVTRHTMTKWSGWWYWYIVNGRLKAYGPFKSGRKAIIHWHVSPDNPHPNKSPNRVWTRP